MPIEKSAGTTPSEQLLTQLCDNSFLGFWSFANPFRDQGGPKEICDLLVLCGEDIIIFSDKSCAFIDSGDLQRDWERWYRRAIGNSVKQIHGGERWIRQHPDRIFLNKDLDQPIPVAIGDPSKLQVHRVVVALGARKACRRHRGGRGSLTLKTGACGVSSSDAFSPSGEPFVLHDLGNELKPVHVFDDVSLPLVLKHLDTITDFVSYLKFKEGVFAAGKIGRIVGEENLLALYLSRFNESEHWRETLGRVNDGTYLEIPNGGWDILMDTESFQQWRRDLRLSKLWDGIIKQFAFHAFDGSLTSRSPQAIETNEQIFRVMAREPRAARFYLSSLMMRRWSERSKGQVNSRLVPSPTEPKTLYAFIYYPKEYDTMEKYREERRGYLEAYCSLALGRNRSFDQVIGISTESGNEPYRTYDVILLECSDHAKEADEVLDELAKELGVTGRIPSQSDQRKRRQRSRGEPRNSIAGRNDPCPCGSQRKFKKCCLRKR